MKFLVTGAAGFLGRHVARHLRDVGHTVTGFDVTAFEEEGIESFQGDLTEANSVEQAIRQSEVVAHIGAIGDVYLAGQQPPLAAAVNVVGTANVIEAALRHHVRIVYASTWEVYGEPQYQPIDELHPTMPDHPYSITKLAGESLVLSSVDLQGASGVALRLGTAYGTGLRANSVFRIFIDRARRGEPITIQGDGSQGRQFTHAHDIARAFERAARSTVTGEAFNVVASQVVTIADLANAVVSRLPTTVTFGDPRPGDVPPATVSAEKAAEYLGWRAEVDFEAGLDDLIASLLEVRDAP